MLVLLARLWLVVVLVVLVMLALCCVVVVLRCGLMDVVVVDW